MPVARNIQPSDKKFWSKLHYSKNDIVVAICDKELLGKKIKVGRSFKVDINKKFYGGVRIDEKQAVELMEKATIGNFFGRKIISLAEEHGFITKENIILFKGIPHAQFVKLL